MSQVSENPFKYSDTNKRYHTYDYYLRSSFGEKCAKITLDAGFTCPNIDGSRGVGGCIYCSGGSRSRGCDGLTPLKEQYESQREQILKKWTVNKFIPYLQAYTNSYTSTENFEKILNEVASFDGAVMIDIATRADCLEDEKIKILKEVSEKIPITVELGLQSSDDKTAQLINRCHTYEEFTDCFSRLRLGAPKVKIAVHIINGLPGEGREQMIKTLRDVDKLHPDIVKIHLLHIIKDTPLAKMYEQGKYTPLDRDEYINTVCDQLELLSPDTVVERITGDGLRESLVAPLWSLKKTTVINDVDKEMYRRGSYQGINIP
ncbi:MAG: TIGR01212 family radical SAM protein [Clostridia bacterium]|nr:TIGR01212 family radical SAM protein [Clostridia bacterium]